MNNEELKQKLKEWSKTPRKMTIKEDTLVNKLLLKFYKENGFYPIKNYPKPETEYISVMNCSVLAGFLDYFTYMQNIQTDEYLNELKQKTKEEILQEILDYRIYIINNLYAITTQLYGMYNYQEEKNKEREFLEGIATYLLANKYNKLDVLANKANKHKVKRLYRFLQYIDENEYQKAVEWAKNFVER